MLRTRSLGQADWSPGAFPFRLAEMQMLSNAVGLCMPKKTGAVAQPTRIGRLAAQRVLALALPYGPLKYRKPEADCNE